MAGHDAQTVLAAAREQRDDMVSFIERLVAVESPSSVPASQAAVFDLLEEALDVAGYRMQRNPGNETGGQVCAAPAGHDYEPFAPEGALSGGMHHPGAPAQLLIGHGDTVWPLGTLQDMPLRIDARTMHGPGVFDMKAGLAQAVFALRTLHRLRIVPPAAPLMFVNSDEEIGSPESAAHIIRLAKGATRVFVMEPALGREGRLKTARKGVGQFRVKVRGKAAHAGLDPDAGRSAILELSHQIQRLFALNDPERGISVNVGVIGGGTRPNVIASESEAVVDVRAPTAPDARRIEEQIHALTPVTDGVTVSVTGSVERAPLERNARNQALWHIARAAAADLGLEIEEGFAGGGSDGNLTSPFAATLDGLGGVGDGAHAAHEHIEIDRSVERCALLAMLLAADLD